MKDKTIYEVKDECLEGSIVAHEPGSEEYEDAKERLTIGYPYFTSYYKARRKLISDFRRYIHNIKASIHNLPKHP